ncbi:DUF6308 family protein [Streptomyces sp. SID5643]|uniref:DUF6308 family protein n=1 Tax=Streptomyces sp. SID5643 TaxID=2690307 RepID=UPI001F1AC6A7|nr:DUF6308 family protein [Streptomyces sp. SID5643]
MHGALSADNHALHRELLALRQSADLTATVSALRVCDVVLWMHHRTDHQQRSCIGTCSPSATHKGALCPESGCPRVPGETPCDLRCTKVPTISLIPYLLVLRPIGISAGHEGCRVPTTDPGHSRTP